MTRIGLDIGVTTGGAIIWAVFADTNRYAAHAQRHLWRRFGAKCRSPPASAPMSWSADRASTVALQPLSVQGQLGLNIAAGIGALELHTSR